MTARTAGIVLCGGQSLRMGTDKCSMVLNGKTLLESAVCCLRTTSVKNVYTVGTTAADIEDKHPHHGPAVAALDALRSVALQGVEYLLVIPVDMPALTSLLLNQLLDLAIQHECGCYIGRHMMPLVLKLDPAFVTMATAHFEHNSSLSMRDLIALNQAAALPTEYWDSEQLININYPDSWQALLTRQHG